MRSATFLLLCGMLAGRSAAQVCAAGSVLRKNDVLPDQPMGPLTVAIVPGLCDLEAAMQVFTVGGPVRVTQVGIVYAHRLGTNGVQAVADVEIYDGATVNAQGRYTLGPLVFKLSNGSTNLQLQSTGLNVFTLPTPVRCVSGKVVVAFRMIMNLAAGSCQTGYDANFATDAQFVCRPGENILDAIGHGPVDPCTYRGFGVPLYPNFFRGNWVLRACVAPEVSVSWTGNPTPGGFVSLNYIAPGQAGDFYFAMVSGGTSMGIGTPWGLIPLDPDPIFTCFLGGCRPALLGAVGQFNASGNAFGALQIPNDQSLRGLRLFVGFFSWRAPNLLVPFQSISSPSPAIVIN